MAACSISLMATKIVIRKESLSPTESLFSAVAVALHPCQWFYSASCLWGRVMTAGGDNCWQFANQTFFLRIAASSRGRSYKSDRADLGPAPLTVRAPPPHSVPSISQGLRDAGKSASVVHAYGCNQKETLPFRRDDPSHNKFKRETADAAEHWRR